MSDHLNLIGICCPLTGEVLDPTDADSMIEAYSRMDVLAKELRQSMTAIRVAIGALAVGDAKTRRVNGDRHRIRVVAPLPNWNQPKLKEAWEKHEALARRYLRLARIDPQLREIKKLRSETGTIGFVVFRDLVLSAEEPATSPPTIFLETSSEQELDAQELVLRRDLAASVSEEDA